MSGERIGGNQAGSPEAVSSEVEEHRKPSPLGNVIFGVAKTTGKAARASRKALEAMSTAGGKRLRDLDALSRCGATKEQKRSKKALARLEQEIQILQCRLGQQLAENAIGGQRNPANDPQVQENLKVIKGKLNQVKELEELVRSMEQDARLAEEQPAPDTAPEAKSEEKPKPKRKRAPAKTKKSTSK